MIADLKPYPEREESGLSWLGEVPAKDSPVPGDRRSNAA